MSTYTVKMLTLFRCIINTSAVVLKLLGSYCLLYLLDSDKIKLDTMDGPCRVRGRKGKYIQGLVGKFEEKRPLATLKTY
jgi:hypothetical protein